jgi:hypothetical protein
MPETASFLMMILEKGRSDILEEVLEQLNISNWRSKGLSWLKYLPRIR